MILEVSVSRAGNGLTRCRLPATPVHAVCRCARLHSHRCLGRAVLLQGNRRPVDRLSGIVCAGGVDPRRCILPRPRPVHSNRTWVGRVCAGRLRVEEDIGVEQVRPFCRGTQLPINVVARLRRIPLNTEEMILGQVRRGQHINILVWIGAVVRSDKHAGVVWHNECSNCFGGWYNAHRIEVIRRIAPVETEVRPGRYTARDQQLRGCLEEARLEWCETVV